MTNGKAILALVTDEELLTRTMLREMVETGRAEIAGECANGREALAAIEALCPDLIFLRLLQLLGELTDRRKYI